MKLIAFVLHPRTTRKRNFFLEFLHEFCTGVCLKYTKSSKIHLNEFAAGALLKFFDCISLKIGMTSGQKTYIEHRGQIIAYKRSMISACPDLATTIIHNDFMFEVTRYSTTLSCMKKFNPENGG
jgi:hypothetical protein